MSKQKKKAPIKTAANVFVRKLKAKDNQMLADLAAITGKSSNASNVMKASYGYLEKIAHISKLDKIIQGLNHDVDKLKQTIERKTMDNDKLQANLDKTQKAFTDYKRTVTVSVLSDAKKLTTLANNVSRNISEQSARLKNVTSILSTSVNKIAKR